MLKLRRSILTIWGKPMTDLLADQPTPLPCAGSEDGAKPIEAFPSREAALGDGLTIRRALPNAVKRMVGAWCFLDHFGPLRFGKRKAMDVAPHPHMGLQTVTWLFEGEMLHKDSLGYRQLVLPGQLNVMTSGKGIAHSEETPPDHSGKLHGVQFWTALPDSSRHGKPSFDHYPSLPVVTQEGLSAQIFAGEMWGRRSPAEFHTPLLGLDVTLTGPDPHAFPLRTDFEHALVVVQGSLRANHHLMTPAHLYDLGTGRSQIIVKRAKPSGQTRFILIGGLPFGEEILMWWNFVARGHEEIQSAREDWEQGRRFGSVPAYEGNRLHAPKLKYRLV